ncbi:MAG: dephospho-CoA kinase [Flavobacteriaceae bacterium]
MKKIAVTGGIGSGKSYVCDLIASKGFPVFNSDRWAKDLMVSDAQLKRAIEQLIGDEAYQLDQDDNIRINQAYIASRIFGQAALRLQLEQLVHPVVRMAFEQWVKEQTTALVFQESALILSTEYYKNFDAIVLVSCSDELRISRVIQRDNVDRMTVISRMKAQPDFESLLDRVTHVIDNSGDQSLEDQVEALIVDLIGHSDL